MPADSRRCGGSNTKDAGRPDRHQGARGALAVQGALGVQPVRHAGLLGGHVAQVELLGGDDAGDARGHPHAQRLQAPDLPRVVRLQWRIRLRMRSGDLRLQSKQAAGGQPRASSTQHEAGWQAALRDPTKSLTLLMSRSARMALTEEYSRQSSGRPSALLASTVSKPLSCTPGGVG